MSQCHFIHHKSHMAWSGIESCRVTVVTAGSSALVVKLIVVRLIRNYSPFICKPTVHYRVHKSPHRTVSTTDESSPHACTVRHRSILVLSSVYTLVSLIQALRPKITQAFRKVWQCNSSLSVYRRLKNSALAYLSVDTLNASDRSYALSNSH
jgi:hypothetical protein